MSSRARLVLLLAFLAFFLVGLVILEWSARVSATQRANLGWPALLIAAVFLGGHCVISVTQQRWPAAFSSMLLLAGLVALLLLAQWQLGGGLLVAGLLTGVVDQLLRRLEGRKAERK